MSESVLDGKGHGCHVRFDNVIKGAVDQLNLESNGISLALVCLDGVVVVWWSEPLIKVGERDGKKVGIRQTDDHINKFNY